MKSGNPENQGGVVKVHRVFSMWDTFMVPSNVYPLQDCAAATFYNDTETNQHSFKFLQADLYDICIIDAAMY